MGWKRAVFEGTNRCIFVVTVCLFAIADANSLLVDEETVSKPSVLESFSKQENYRNLYNTATIKHFEQLLPMKTYPFLPPIITSNEKGVTFSFDDKPRQTINTQDNFGFVTLVADPYAQLPNAEFPKDDHKEGKKAEAKTYNNKNPLPLYLKSKLTPSINKTKRQKRRIFNNDFIPAVFNKNYAKDYFPVPVETNQKVTEISTADPTQEILSKITESHKLEKEIEGSNSTILAKESIEPVSRDPLSEPNKEIIMSETISENRNTITSESRTSENPNPEQENELKPEATNQLELKLNNSEEHVMRKADERELENEVTTGSIPAIDNVMESMDAGVLKHDMNFTVKDKNKPVINEKEPVPETAMESDSETEPDPEIVVESETESNQEPEVEPETVKNAETETEPEAEDEPEPEIVKGLETEPDPKTEPKPEIVKGLETEPELEAEPKPGMEAKPKPEKEPEVEPSYRAKTLRDTERLSKSEPGPEIKLEGIEHPAALGPQPGSETVSMPETEPKPVNALATQYQSPSDTGSELAEEPKSEGTQKPLSEQEPEAEPEEELSDATEQHQSSSHLKTTTELSGSVLSQQELMVLEPDPESEAENASDPGHNNVTKELESIAKPLSGQGLDFKISVTLALQGTSDPLADNIPESEPQSATITNSETEPNIIANPEPEPKVVPDIIANPEPEPEVEPDIIANPETEPEVEPDIIANPETEPEVEPDIIANPETESEAEPEVDPKAEPETGTLKDHPGGTDLENDASKSIITEHLEEEDHHTVSKNNSESSMKDEEKVSNKGTLINEDIQADQEDVTTEVADNLGNKTLNDSSPVSDEGTTLGGIKWTGSRITLFIVQIIIMVETVFGNLMVILSVKVEKKLQTPFNYYIVNLALTDFNVGLSVMSLFMIYNLYDYFPFNNALCSYWIWSDYTMTFESVMTLAAISVDRLWSVTWSLHYRNHNSGKKSLMIILGTWITVALIWLPPFIYDRVVNSYDPGICYWDTVLNKNLVIWVGIMGYYSPLFIMIGAYARIMWVVKKRASSIRDAARKDNPVGSQPTETSVSGDGPTEHKKLVNAAPVVDERQEAKLRREMKAVYTLLNIVVIFLICWVPFYILFVLSAWFPSSFPDWYVNFAYWMAYINSAVNPVLYPLSSLEFRAAYKKIFYMIICKK